MTKPPRKRISPIERSSISSKKFKRLVTTEKRVSDSAMLEASVIHDLRRGCLVSLAKYLSEKGGIANPSIAQELRKLISGDCRESKYQLVVIEHPEAPRQRGGRPKKNESDLTDRDREIADRYEELRTIEGKNYLAREQVAVELKVSEITVKRALWKVDQHRRRQLAQQNEQNERDEVLSRREKALSRYLPPSDADP